MITRPTRAGAESARKRWPRVIRRVAALVALVAVPASANAAIVKGFDFEAENSEDAWVARAGTNTLATSPGTTWALTRMTNGATTAVPTSVCSPLTVASNPSTTPLDTIPATKYGSSFVLHEDQDANRTWFTIPTADDLNWDVSSAASMSFSLLQATYNSDRDNTGYAEGPPRKLIVRVITGNGSVFEPAGRSYAFDEWFGKWVRHSIPLRAEAWTHLSGATTNFATAITDIARIEILVEVLGDAVPADATRGGADHTDTDAECLPPDVDGDGRYGYEYFALDQLTFNTAQASVSGKVADKYGRPLRGVTIELDDGFASVANRTTVTNSLGNYAFANVPNGNYTIQEYDPPGYKSVSDVDGANDNEIGIVVEDINITGRNFIDEPRYGHVSGLVFRDWNDNGLRGSGEAGWGGIRVDLINAANKVVKTTRTNKSGVYNLTNIAPKRKYRVRIVVPRTVYSSRDRRSVRLLTPNGVVNDDNGLGTRARNISTYWFTVTTQRNSRVWFGVLPPTRLAIAKYASRSSARTGQAVKFTIVVRNTRRAAARGVRVCDVVPSAFRVTKTGGGTLRGNRLCWRAGQIPTNRRIVRRFLAVARPSRTTTVTNVATAKAVNSTAVRASRSVNVIR